MTNIIKRLTKPKKILLYIAYQVFKLKMLQAIKKSILHFIIKNTILMRGYINKYNIYTFIIYYIYK